MANKVQIEVIVHRSEPEGYIRYTVPEDFAMADAYQAIMCVPRAIMVTYGENHDCFMKQSDGTVLHGTYTEEGMVWNPAFS